MTNILILGEAWGAHEEEAGMPFVGPSGLLLNLMLAHAGIERKDCYLTNVFNFRPENNDLTKLCGPRQDALAGYPAITKGRYVHAKYKTELDRLYREIETVRPNLILALGATACWALQLSGGIKRLRGYITGSRYGKVLPSYHPAAVLREYKLRPILMADIGKAARESTFPEVRQVAREIWTNPSLADLAAFEPYINASPELSIDIETIGDQITCIGFAPTTTRCLVVSFFIDDKARANSFWPTLADEIAAWNWVKRICALPKRIVGQNFLYDLKSLWTYYGIKVPSATDDTMLLHHAMQPEMEKGLNFLGSIYANEPSWKYMRKSLTTKLEDT